jgi:hypothetical protein
VDYYSVDVMVMMNVAADVVAVVAVAVVVAAAVVEDDLMIRNYYDELDLHRG